MKMQASSGQIVLISALEKLISMINIFEKSKSDFTWNTIYDDVDYKQIIPENK